MCIEDGIFSDWTIISEEGQRFQCHRNILAAKSSTMKAMMTTEMKEKEEKETKLNYSGQQSRDSKQTCQLRGWRGR